MFPFPYILPKNEAEFPFDQSTTWAQCNIIAKGPKRDLDMAVGATKGMSSGWNKVSTLVVFVVIVISSVVAV